MSPKPVFQNYKYAICLTAIVDLSPISLLVFQVAFYPDISAVKTLMITLFFYAAGSLRRFYYTRLKSKYFTY
jgi:hypothetical protein